jgi:hypothetical protein
MTLNRAKNLPSLLVCAAALAASITVAGAGTCLPEIGRAQADINARLEAKAATGPSASESTAAKMHHQPTPHSLAITESRVGTVSIEDVKELEAIMARARDADSVDDWSACKQALTAVYRILRWL